MVFLLFTSPSIAGTYQGKGSDSATSYIVYIPDKLDLKKRYPWILGLSPDGNGQEALSAMREGCDANGWVLVASNNSKNGMDWKIIERSLIDTINSSVRTLPVDPSKMYVGGLSGGGMVSHWLTAKFPQLVKGVVINCGMMSRDFKQQIGYPSGKDIVFMTNPHDFRYNEIREDFQYVTSRGCKACWIEFPGSHQWAPPQYYATAFKWLDEHAKRPKS